MQRFEYIGLHCTDDGLKIDDFSLFANVLSRTEDTVTYQRFHKFGKLKSEKPVTISVEDFNHFYQPLTDEQYRICIEMEAKYG